MSSCEAVPTPWVRKSTAQGRRRVSLRLRSLATRSPSASLSTDLDERGTKRTSSPVGTTAKRMRLLDCEEEEENRLMEEREEREHDESIDDRDEEDIGGGDEEIEGVGYPDMRVTSSYSSSSGESHTVYEEYGMEEEEEEYVEEDIEDEEDVIEVDKTDIFTSDEEDKEQEDNRVDGPIDLFERMQRFRKMSVELGQRFEMVPLKEPHQLTHRCHGIGPAAEVWSVLCHKDELHSICNEHFMRDHNPRDPIPSNYRAILIDWMQEVCWAEKLHRETFHLAIDYIDRVMAKKADEGMSVKTRQYQLVGTTALFIAAKYEEIYPPKVDDIVQYTADAFTADEVRKVEMMMLKVLEWELNVITPLHWAHLFLELLTGNSKPSTSSSSRFTLNAHSIDGFYCEGEENELPATTGSCAREDYMHIAYVMDTVVLSDGCRKYSNRVLAAAVLYAVYDAEEAIHQVTGLSCWDEKVKDAVDWVNPIVMYCEQTKDHNAPLPVIEGIRPDAIHTIQLYRSNISTAKKVEDVMSGIQQVRTYLNEKESKRRPAAIRLGQISNIDH